MIDVRSWKEFREAGLLWWVNRSLHLFGWAIVVSLDEAGEVLEVKPCRVPYRGFDRADEEDGFRMVSGYLAAAAPTLLAEAQD